MTAPAQVRAFWAMRRAVCNAEVTVRRDAETDAVEAEDDRGRYASAPTLEQALLALDFLEDGEHVRVDNEGRAVCLESGGAGCERCGGSGVPESPPRSWPCEGMVV